VTQGTLPIGPALDLHVPSFGGLLMANLYAWRATKPA
jgi:hypothetical protein